MSYGQLHTHCQGLALHVRRNSIRDKVLEITGTERVSVVRTTLDVDCCRGFFLSARNTTHRLVQQFGTHLIVLARGLPPEWERFVYVKELMHLFDDPAEAADTGETFERVLNELGLPGERNWSPQMISELNCFWMALGAFCPETERVKFATEREKGQSDDYAVSLKLKIPQPYVRYLFEDRFLPIMEELRR